MNRIGVAVIGLGNAFEPHAKSLMDLSDRVEVRWAVSRSPARTRSVAARFGFPVTTDAADAIADPAVQVMLLLTPANTHLELAEACFAGGKHVLCEKPLETSCDRAERLVVAGRRADRRLGVVLQLRFGAGSLRLRAVLKAGGLGTIQAASMSVPWWRPQAYYDAPGRGTRLRDGGGVLLTQAIHTIDLFRSFVGVREVEAAQVCTTALHRMETEDYAAALVRVAGGAPGTIMATTAAYPGSRGWIEIIGSRGTARMHGGGLRLSWLDGREEAADDTDGSGSGADVMDFSHEGHRAVSGEEALETQRLIEAILAKAA